MPPADSTTRRPWYRLHLLTILVGCMATAVLVVLVIPAEIKYPRPEYRRGMALQSWHGWPWMFAFRTHSRKSTTPYLIYNSAWPSWTCAEAWTFDEKFDWMDFKSLGYDLAVAAAMIVATTAVVEIWRRRRQRATQIGLREMLAAVVGVALIGWWLNGHRELSQAEAQFRKVSGSFEDAYRGAEWLARLTGQRPDYFRHLVEVFWARYDETRDDDPPDLSGLPYVETLYWADTRTTPEQIAAFATLQYLKWLNIEAPMTRETFAAISKLQGLESLVIEAWQVFDSDGLASLAQLNDLQHLQIRWMPSSDPRLLATVSRLKGLQAPSIRGNGYDQLGNLKHLHSLVIDGHRLTDADLARFDASQPLEHLALRGTAVTGGGFRHLVDLPRLHSLDLTASPVNNEGAEAIGRMRSLKYLELDRTKITDVGLQHLHPLTGLKRLNIENTATSAAERQALRDAMPNTEILDTASPAQP